MITVEITAIRFTAASIPLGLGSCKYDSSPKHLKNPGNLDNSAGCCLCVTLSEGRPPKGKTSHCVGGRHRLSIAP